MNSVAAMTIGARFALRSPKRKRPFQGEVAGVYAAVAEGHPRRGWFSAIVLFRDAQGRLWEFQTRAFLDFDKNSPVFINEEHPGLMTVAVPAGSPTIPVRFFNPPK